MWYWLGFGEVHLSSGWKPETVSEKSFKKQMKGSSTGPAHGPCKWGVCVTSSAHGSAARTVRGRNGSARVLARTVSIHWRRTGQAHGPCRRGVCADFQSGTGRADQHGPCWLFGLHGSRWFGTGRVRDFLVQHGACRLARVRFIFCTGRAIFFFWGRKPNLSQFSGLFWFENLNWIKLGIGLIQNFIMKLSLKF